MRESRRLLLWLLGRRHQPASWLFVATAIPLALIGLLGAAYGALIPYVLLASICILQFRYPTLLGWGFVLALYATGSTLYLYVLIGDLILIVHRQRPETFQNPFDSTFFGTLLVCFLALTTVLVCNKPLPIASASAGGENAA